VVLVNLQGHNFHDYSILWKLENTFCGSNLVPASVNLSSSLTAEEVALLIGEDLSVMDPMEAIIRREERS